MPAVPFSERMGVSRATPLGVVRFRFSGGRSAGGAGFGSRPHHGLCVAVGNL